MRCSNCDGMGRDVYTRPNGSRSTMTCPVCKGNGHEPGMCPWFLHEGDCRNPETCQSYAEWLESADGQAHIASCPRWVPERA